jgi:hypothetical protein
MSRDGAKSKTQRRRSRGGFSFGDAYAVLGLRPSADRVAVHAAYRKLVLRYHPDKDGGNMERFKELTAAYRVLEQRFRIEQEESGEGAGECDRCGAYDLLLESPDGSRWCPACIVLAGRRPLLPAPPVVIVSCVVTIILLFLAAGCLLAGWISRLPSYSAAALVLGLISLLSLAVTCATVIYTAEPLQLRRKRRRGL